MAALFRKPAWRGNGAGVRSKTGAPRTGVYLCRGALATADEEALLAYAGQLPGVSTARGVPEPAALEPEALARELEREGLDTVVVAGETPGFAKPVFARALALAGGDAERVRLASFREHGAVNGLALERAKAILVCAVEGVPFPLAAEPEAVPVNSATLVVGGGVAGIQAALEIADAGHQVYLVERRGTIGGHMAMFDKTFPTLDCAACILTPKMVQAGKHPQIHLLVLSEVQEVKGRPGAYDVKVLRHATRVDASACVACNDCAQFCPVSVPSEFDVGIATRKAIYIPFPQAVPNAYLVDPEACTFVKSGGKKCGACVKKCSKGAVHLDAADEVVELAVGQIIVATGYEVFDARRIERYGYGRFPNVLTALEFERLTNASGPTSGKIVQKTKKYNKRTKTEEWVFAADGPSPKTVAVVHCVGSRDTNYQPYCSRVCCMYSLKFAHLVREKLPEARCLEYFIDMRAYGKGYEEFSERIKEEGVRVLRGRPAAVVERDGALFVRGEDVLGDRVLEEPVDMVLLSVGLRPPDGNEELGRLLGLSRGVDGFFEEQEYNAEPGSTERGGIFVAGACQGPKDIPDTVAQASAVAAEVLSAILAGKGRGSRGELTLPEIERKARALARPG
ncbi:MAG TPA: CoB--CoM heterodisulfide reductase iron-sulfur subunit A family protein [Anaeromyxobacteraceae bacterium]|nr:CoB--CoM heterodisulfide reductase iron-sulfur subunit A family protein [Anaeromyxobacteraceae bacterium]